VNQQIVGLGEVSTAEPTDELTSARNTAPNTKYNFLPYHFKSCLKMTMTFIIIIINLGFSYSASWSMTPP